MALINLEVGEKSTAVLGLDIDYPVKTEKFLTALFNLHLIVIPAPRLPQVNWIATKIKFILSLHQLTFKMIKMIDNRSENVTLLPTINQKFTNVKPA